jgi:hypothetical protein
MGGRAGSKGGQVGSIGNGVAGTKCVPKQSFGNEGKSKSKKQTEGGGQRERSTVPS